MPLNVVHLLWGLETGGAQRLIATLARHSPPGRARHAVVSFREGGTALPLLREAGCDVRALPKRPGLDLSVPRRLAALLAELEPRVVHAHDFTGVFWARAALGPRPAPAFVVTDHLAFQALGLLKRNLYSRCLRAADRVVVLSEPTRRGLLARGLPPDRVSRLWLGPDLGPLPGGVTRESARAGLGLAPGEVAVLTCARLEEQKNLLWLVELAGRLARRDPRLRFLVAGEGPLRGRLERRIARLGLGPRFRLLGLRRDVAALLAAADLFALPSRREELPVAVLEAMAAGLPVLAAPVGALPELLEAESGAGRTLPVARVEAWEEGVMELANHPEQRAALGGRGRQFVRGRLDARRTVADMLDLYEAALSRRGRERP